MTMRQLWPGFTQAIVGRDFPFPVASFTFPSQTCLDILLEERQERQGQRREAKSNKTEQGQGIKTSPNMTRHNQTLDRETASEGEKYTFAIVLPNTTLQ